MAKSNFRIRTDIGKDKLVTVDLQQNYDIIEILSLKFTQQDVYATYCADYGVVCGRVTVNNGLGVPNVRVSIFVPVDQVDINDPVISMLYPYSKVNDKDQNNYRYNLLPSLQQHSGHAPTGTFPDQTDILTNEEYLEIFEKYYKYTAKTNDAGDFMIWGVPLGEQTIHFDVDLSDVGCFSLRPYDFIRQGLGVDNFKSKYQFKSSSDLDTLPQIHHFDNTIEVFPFWGNEDMCTIGITRSDFDLSSQGVKIEPKAFLIGGTMTDTGKNSLNKNCEPKKKMGRKCDLTTKPGKVEVIRFTPAKDSSNRPILEEYDLHEDIGDDGAFVFPIPMNMDYLYTDEFGDNVITNDPNKGVPTSACLRMRFSLNDKGLDRLRALGDYVVPNIREYANDVDKSYAFSTNYDDYPSAASSLILNNVEGEHIPQDYFYRFTYNKVYTMSSFQNSFFPSDTFKKDGFVGIKELVPAEEEDCSATHNTPPVNFGIKNYTFTLLIGDILSFLDYIINTIILLFFNVIVKVFHRFGDAVNFWPIRRLARAIITFAYQLQEASQKKLYLVVYPDCNECNGNQTGTTVPNEAVVSTLCKVGSFTLTGTTNSTYTYGGDQIDIASGFPYISLDLSHDTTGGCSASNTIANAQDFVNRQTGYTLSITGQTSGRITNVNLADVTNTSYFFIEEELGFIPLLHFQDGDGIFSDNEYNIVHILDSNTSTSGSVEPLVPLEEGCALYDVPYNTSLAYKYYSGTSNANRVEVTYSPGIPIIATSLYETGGSDYTLPPSYNGTSFTKQTPSGGSEFSSGVFYIVPGSQSNIRLLSILWEYKVRRRIGKLFCGGIVNYSFIDNWLSGVLYFFQFKAKRGKYCGNVVHYVDSQSRFYYRSTAFDPATNKWGVTIGNNNIRLGRSTTFVDMGPRDEFIKEICVDPNLDPNCSVARSIGPTSFQDFGDIMGLVINYRLETTQDGYDIDSFFNNGGFSSLGADEPLNGDILQLISTNNETGINGFNLTHPQYIGYNYEVLQPIRYPEVFSQNGDARNWGPTPITLRLELDGQRIRECLNDPLALGKESQSVPFYLWDKKGTGFGSYTNATAQSWDYGSVQVQNLQGMTYGYNNTTPNTNEKYLLLPITYTFSGLTVGNLNVTNEVDFDQVSLTDHHTNDNNEYPGYTYLYVTSGTTTNPLAGILYTRYGAAGTWNTQSWNYTDDFIVPQTQDYYSGTKQILSTPFQFYFGLRHGKTGLDKFIDLFGPKGAFPPIDY
jgi:hypothetical protein